MPPGFKGKCADLLLQVTGVTFPVLPLSAVDWPN